MCHLHSTARNIKNRMIKLVLVHCSTPYHSYHNNVILDELIYHFTLVGDNLELKSTLQCVAVMIDI